MREILFRGKTFDNEWVEGLLVWIDHNDETALIRVIGKDGVGYFDFLVDFETVGQYTGLTDKDGKKIFEGDIVTVPLSGKPAKGVVEYLKTGICGFAAMSRSVYSNYVLQKNCAYKVVSNIHDNPELLEVTE